MLFKRSLASLPSQLREPISMSTSSDRTEISLRRLSEVGDSNSIMRFDAEFFNKAALDALDRIRRNRHNRIGEICDHIQHPVEIKREYVEHGLATIMAKNVKSNRVDFSDLRYMAADKIDKVSKNRLFRDDVVVTRSGANYGRSTAWKYAIEAFACADLLIVRSPTIPSGYLSSFLESEQGSALVLRGGYGAAQPHIAPRYLLDVEVPRFGDLECRIDSIVSRSVSLDVSASQLGRQGDDMLCDLFGLENWGSLKGHTYTARASDVADARRLDADFFSPRIHEVLEVLTSDGLSIGDVVSTRRDRFNAPNIGTFRYIEIGDLDGFGATNSKSLACADAPSRATWRVREDDVITSTVRPLRRLSAQISQDQDGSVCSSGFVVLEPDAISPEVLVTYLRLPIICEILDLYASASMYPAITEEDILGLPIRELDQDTECKIVEIMHSSRDARSQAGVLREASKAAVDIAILEGEAESMMYLDRLEEVS